MITLTGFADEISSDLEEQLDVLESENIRYLELRGVWGKNVLELNEQESLRVKSRLAARGFGVSSIGSPIGKINITDDFGPHFEAAAMPCGWPSYSKHRSSASFLSTRRKVSMPDSGTKSCRA